jgi:choline dehydrogenase-like flavoprotein
MTHVDNIDNYDYIVIGGGTSGAVVARRLAEAQANYSVCLLEAGPRLVCLNFIIISRMFQLLLKSKRCQRYSYARSWCSIDQIGI